MRSKSGSSSAGETPALGCPPRARELLPKHITSLQAATIILETKMATAAGANITTRGGFPEHIFLETFAIRRRVDPGQRPQPRATVVRRRPRRPAAGRSGLGAYLRR